MLGESVARCKPGSACCPAARKSLDSLRLRESFCARIQRAGMNIVLCPMQADQDSPQQRPPALPVPHLPAMARRRSFYFAFVFTVWRGWRPRQIINKLAKTRSSFS